MHDMYPVVPIKVVAAASISHLQPQMDQSYSRITKQPLLFKTYREHDSASPALRVANCGLIVQHKHLHIHIHRKLYVGMTQDHH